MKFDVLTLERASRTGDPYSTARDFMDFFVNGRSLQALVDVRGRVGAFGSLDAKSERSLARQLTLRAPSELRSGRVPIYRCSECGDLGCGALAVRVTEYDEGFGWSEFVSESNLFRDTDEPGEDAWDGEGPFLLFEREAYLAEFRRYG